jgi:hypothetical protein
LSIPTDVIAGSTDVAKVDKEALHSTMSELVTRYASRLKLDYGDISGNDQTWEPIPGEEVSPL